MADSSIGLGGDAGGGGASPNIFDVFADGEAPYAGIRAKYGRADADWSARGVAVVPAVKSSALLPISGSMTDGWRFTFKPGFLSEEEEGNNWKLIRRERASAVPAVASSVRWEYQTGQFVTITAVTAGAAGNNIGIKIDPAAQASHQTEFAVSRAGTRFDITYRTVGETVSQFITAANAHFTRIVFSLDAGGTSSNNITRSLPIIGADYSFMTGGVDAIPEEPISFGFRVVAEELIANIKTTDTLADIRGSIGFRTVFSPFAEATVVGTVDEATATFAIPANDPGIAFAGGKNGNPLGVEIDPLLNTIDIRYDPVSHTLADIFRVMQAAGVSPEYRGGGAPTNTPEALGWVRSIGPLTAASPGTGITVAAALTAAQIKQRYESNANTNAFTNPLKAKVDSVDTGAADDQTGAEIKTAYEGEGDTNAYTNAEKTKLGDVEVTSDVLAKILEGTGVVIDRTTTPGKISVSSTGGALPVVYLGRPTTVAAGALTFTKPTGYPATGRYPVGTLLSFISGYFTPFENSNTNLRVIIGTDSYTFEDVNTGSLYYRDLVTDTAHLLVATGSGTLQLLAPSKDPTGAEIKAAYEGQSDTNAFTNALKTKLEGIATAATAVSVVNVLAKIFAGTGININRAVDGQITITNTGSGGGGSGTADGVINKAVFDDVTQTVTFTNSLGGTVTLDLGSFITATELTTALTPYTKADGSVAFTAVVAGITPTDDAHLSTKKYVDDADDLKASLSGATFAGETSGITPVNALNFATKAYVDTAVAGTTPPSVRSELIYYGLILAANAADEAAANTYARTIDVSTLDMEDATVAGHNITVGPSADGDFFLILVPATHDLLTLINLGTHAEVRNAYSRSANARNDLGTPSEQYSSYVLGPLNPGVSISYRLTLVE